MPRSAKQSGMLVIPADVNLDVDSSSDTATKVQITPLQLPDSKSEKQIIPLFAVSEGGAPSMIVEINRFSHPFGSWLLVPENVDLVPHVCSNGNMTFVTKVDPLFPLLIVMDSSRNNATAGVFQPLEAMCQMPDGTNLAFLCSPDQFVHLCDVKEAGGDKYYRLNDDKVTQWLLQKHKSLAQHPNINDESALEILSQYVTEKWAQGLRSSLESDEKLDKANTTAPQTGEDLAMAIMMEDAKETNRAKRLQRTNGFKPGSATKKKGSSTKKRSHSKASSFWSSAKSS